MFYKVLIPVDLAYPQELPLLIEAARELTSDNPHVDFIFLYIDDSKDNNVVVLYPDQQFNSLRQRDNEDKLLALLRNLMPATLHYSSRVRRGVVHQKILEEAGSRYADIIVMMAQKPGQGRYSIGSNAERVVRHAKCSVMVVREG